MSPETRALMLTLSAMALGCMSEPADGPGTGGTSAGGAGAGASGGSAAASGSAGKSSGGSGGSGQAGQGAAGRGAGGSSAGGTTGGASGASGAGIGGASGSGTGGYQAGGVAGTSGSAGASGSAGSGASGGSTSSTGCGSATTPESGVLSIEVDGTSRDYTLKVPDDYDSSRPYPLIFGWHWRGGSMNDVAGTGFQGGYYGLEELADGSAIFVAPDGIDDGWANPGGRDIAFLDAMLERFESELCIDKSRIFSTGFSYGGMMSFAVGCARGDVFRAIAPMSGALYSGCEDGDSPVAVWGAHGDNDEVVPLDDGEAGLQEFLDRNGCGTAALPTDPSPCVSYEGCAAGVPVTWCEFSGGHSPPNFAADAIWEFFSQF